MAGKTDRRVKYTKMVIKNSFVRLLGQRPIAKITVKEICEGADINRATFYAHYSDQYDLLRQIETEVIDDINRYLEDYDFKDNARILVEMVEKILYYVGENAELFNLLLNSNGDMTFQQEIINIIGRQHFDSLTGGNPPSREDAEYLFHFLASGAVGVIQMWLGRGMKKPARDLAELMLDVAVTGRAAFE